MEDFKHHIHNLLQKLGVDIYFLYKLRPSMKEVEGRNLIGVEIGTYRGHNAKRIIKNMDIKRLYLIDPYTSYEEEDMWVNRMCPLDKAERYARKKLKRYKNLIFIKKKSEDAVKDIPDNLDFVYIDGNHSYKKVKKDIELYYPKLKEGCIMGGHDFESHETEGVKNAVIDFITKNNLQLFVRRPDWWIKKGEKRRKIK